MTCDTLWSWLHALAWSTYLGGALLMELAWRPAQQHLPGPQTAVACQVMGRRYRWLALGALAMTAVTGGLLVPARAETASLSVDAGYGRTLVALAVCWAALVAVVASMGATLHPALHARTSADVDEQARDAARREVGRAIRRMDRALRVELAIALVATLLGASLPYGGLT